MSNFSITFERPWLLLLLIPALALTLLPYFLLAKKYRRTRNRVISMILHMIVMTLCISVLSGINFRYDVPNSDNEVILLVDLSHSGREERDKKDAFVKSVIDESGGQFRLGVVTFGFDQVYAAELTSDKNAAYASYLSAEAPDDSATDIASAIGFAKGLFTRPETAKIVLITDGIPTDGDAISAIKTAAADGVRLDTVFFGSSAHDEVEIVGVTTPDYSIVAGDVFQLEMTVQSSFEGKANIRLFDEDVNGNVSDESYTVDFVRGTQTFRLDYFFEIPDMHKLHFEIESDGDTLTENNSYYSYIFLNVFDKILIIERDQDEGIRLNDLLDDSEYDVTRISVYDTEKMPATLDELRAYDQVILVNIANADMPAGFDTILYNYVYEIGGGLFTVGGNKGFEADGTPIANAYDRADMYGTLYQQMLPVQAINYTPPLGLMIIIDRSGSMSGQDTATGRTYLDLAKDGAIACLNSLSERDWCGVMALDDQYHEEAEITPLPEMAKLRAAIDAIEIGGGTIYSGAIERAGEALKALRGVEKKHIVLVTDGQPAETAEEYGEVAKRYYEAGITFSVVGINVADNDAVNMEQVTSEAGGRFYDVKKPSELTSAMKEDLRAPEIRDVNYETFTPTIGDHTSAVSGIEQEDLPALQGFYGTKAKEGALVPLKGPYVPIYAQWKFGMGTVGSFMCDLEGLWSEDFLKSEAGTAFLNNVVSSLFPIEDIRPREIDVGITEENYTTQISVYTDLAEGETIEITVRGPSSTRAADQQKIITSSDGLSRNDFLIRDPGIHEILVEKKDARGHVTARYSTYKVFSYSAEYDAFKVPTLDKETVEGLATGGKVGVAETPWEVFEEYEKTLHRTYDPMLPFIITALVLFLLDVAVRKFKFKWLHEIIRDRKAKKEMQAEGGRS